MAVMCISFLHSLAWLLLCCCMSPSDRVGLQHICNTVCNMHIGFQYVHMVSRCVSSCSSMNDIVCQCAPSCCGMLQHVTQTACGFRWATERTAGQTTGGRYSNGWTRHIWSSAQKNTWQHTQTTGETAATPYHPLYACYYPCLVCMWVCLLCK